MGPDLGMRNVSSGLYVFHSTGIYDQKKQQKHKGYVNMMMN